MEVFAYFNKSNTLDMLGALQRLAFCHSIYIGESEKRKKSDISLDETSKVNAFIDNNQQGFFLHIKQGLFDVSLSEQFFSSICFYPSSSTQEQEVLTIIKAYAEAGGEFCYAALGEEFEYRNRVVANATSGKAEAWVGRRLEQYLPGLYHLTFISFKQAKEKSINIDTLANNAIQSMEMPSGVLLKLYDSPHDWVNYKAKIDALCEGISGIFHKQEAECVAAESDNVMDFIQNVRIWP